MSKSKVVTKTKKSKKVVKATVGEAVPNFTLPSTAGDFSLQDLKGKKIVLYFYPKDSTPGCTIEGKEFSDHIKEFRALNAEVYGISRDSVKSHDNFKAKMNFKFELLSDGEEQACKIFDVIKEKNMYGRLVMGIERSTFIIDEKGCLLEEFRKVKAEGHAKSVLQRLKSL